MSNVNTRDEIINTAQKLFYTIGYDKTSIQMILNDIGIAKGTFYHYFKSKSELMLEIVKITVEKTIGKFDEIKNSSLSPIEKMNALFNTSAKYKIANIDSIKAIMFAMYNENNLILRENIKKQNIEFVAPLINSIIEEGMNTGDFKCIHKNLGEMIILLSTSMSDTMASSIINSNKGTYDDSFIEETVDHLKMYSYTIETILEVEHGKLNLYDDKLVRDILEKLS